MHSIAAAAASHGASTSFEVIAGIIIVAFVVGVLVLFGWGPRRSRPVRQSPAASAVRATRRSPAKAANRPRRGGQDVLPQPDDAS